MTWLEALILGIIQGLTEFLPVSSSGHLELGKAIMGVNAERSMIFTVVVHGATVLSTIAIFYKDLLLLLKGLLKAKWNDEMAYIIKIAISIIPVAILGLFFIDEIESFFSGNIRFVGIMLIVTSALLALTYIRKSQKREITFLDSLLIGVAQAAAVLPGVSRSGATIATGLLIGNRKELIAKFSFLMVLIPIIGANLKNIVSDETVISTSVGIVPLLVGFIAAFITGVLACKWMIKIVSRGKLIYFSVYCFIIGLIAIIMA
ncbi:MAG: undecaprenyl-diphosphate phosphatase [Bacteroidetes bacterium]|nr:undecaprenyl-diphosphate phosphatase [Bacteroidota bacterium]